MELQEEVMGTDDYSHIVKGRRTKRQRLLLPAAPGGFSTSSSTEDDQNLQSPTISVEFPASTEEEEDMANCLILLAQGGNREGAGVQLRPEERGGEKFTSRRFTEAATTTNGKAGFYVYECKTCNRCFPSFQALGGHRASHKKPKVEEENNQLISTSLQAGKPVTYNSISNSNSKSRVHECSICGSEFSSGQALGGHMRRHRTATMADGQEPSNNKKNILPLDLNLPAPEEDKDYSKSQSGFAFAGKQPLVFAGSPLVDCHY